MNKKLEVLNNEKGQMAILAMLVLVIALTIGLSVITRTTSNIKLSNNTELSTRAYNAAEAGIEETLRANGSNPQNTSISVGNNASFSVSVTQQGGSNTPYAFPNPVAIDDANQVWMFDYNYYKTNSGAFPPAGGGKYFNDCNTAACLSMEIYWGSGTASPPPTSPDSATPALEVALIYKNASGVFGVEKYAVDPSSTRGNGFTNVSSPTGPFTLANTTQGSKTYYYKYTITLKPGTNTTDPNKRDYLLARLKLLYSTNHELAVNPLGATLLPQGELISSQGTASDLVRKIKVYRSYPTLPSIFDFVLYNGSTSPLQK
ncbi:MAG: pilus assembly PilX N-terminal domain-containing protein [bacterium]|nr:pilus assembly PilX N-terminal domain-containing protein [bacterium]